MTPERCGICLNIPLLSFAQPWLSLLSAAKTSTTATSRSKKRPVVYDLILMTESDAWKCDDLLAFGLVMRVYRENSYSNDASLS